MYTRSVALVGLPLLTAVVAGCSGPAHTYSVVELTSPDVQQRAANTYWKRHDVPIMRDYGYKRVAIVDCSVEFVTRKVEAPLKAVEIKYEHALYQAVADELYATFVAALESRGLEVIPGETVQSAVAFRGFVTQLSIEQSWFGIASDTGRIKRTLIRSPGALRIVEKGRDVEVESVEAALIKEIGADVALRLRARVGVYEGRASLERGTTIWVLSEDVVGNLTADRSLLSDERVAFEKTEGGTTVYSVETEKYVAAMRKMIPPFIEMAFASTP